MNKFLLLCLLTSMASLSKAQTYTTAKSGNSNAASTWVNNQKPPTGAGALCNCTIIVDAGHTLSVNVAIDLTNVNFIIRGTAANPGKLTFQGNNPIRLRGTSSFDIQTSNASIVYTGGSDKLIFLGTGTAELYRGNTTSFPTGQPAGTVLGPASATTASPTTWSNVSLPVTLSDFRATTKSGKVNLSWTTTLEVNSSHFEIERSIDSRTWNKVASVSAGGNTGVAQNYSFTDHSPLNGNNYYRLKIIDIDGQFEYSPIKNVSVAVSGIVITTGPNPAYSTLNVMIAQETANDFEVKLINRSGQIIYNRKYAGSLDRIAIDVSKFPEGNYFVEVVDVNGTKTIKNILVLRK
jgi:hypothetical protein